MTGTPSDWDAFCGDMAMPVPSIAPARHCAEVFTLLNEFPDWPGLAVADEDGKVLGYFSRRKMLSVLSKPLMVDLYAKRPVELLMEAAFMVAQTSETLDAVCERISQDHGESLAEGFVIVDGERYAGLGGLSRILALTVEQARRRSEYMAREKEAVEKAHRHINESIRYASRIQSSLLPKSEDLAGLFHDIAIGWQPRDVVGGDLYWIGQFEHRCLIAVMDCTGHGVPGAFMTAIVASVLDRVLHEHCHDDPAMILQLLNRLVKASLHQENKGLSGDGGSDDGLDAAICLVDPAQGEVVFAGANLPLLYTQDGTICEIKGDRHSLGYRTSRADYVFTNHSLTLNPGESIYLATDGVTDQVGGPKRRLFGRRRLAETLTAGAGLPMREQLDRVFATLAAYRGDEARRDDMALIGVTLR